LVAKRAVTKTGFMKRNSNLTLAIAFGGILAYGAFTNVACDDDNDGTISVTTGRGGHGGGGSGGSGGAGGSSIVTYTVILTPAAEVPPKQSTGTGRATVTLDPSTGTVNVSGTYTDLMAAATAAHLHGPASTTETAPIVVTLMVSGGTSGTISGGGTLTPAEMTALQNGQMYLNVHSAAFTDGEVRAQIAIDTGIGAPQ
jgi:hypothetical protein